MRIKINDKYDGWRLRFAVLPVKIGTTWIWLEEYWTRFEGLYTNVRLYEEIKEK